MIWVRNIFWHWVFLGEFSRDTTEPLIGAPENESRYQKNYLIIIFEMGGLTEEKRLIIALCLSAMFFLVELGGGLWSNSLALLSDSFHLLTGNYITAPKCNSF